jgi:type I restriction enzyme S subunit
MFDTAPHTWERITLGEIVARAGGSIQTGPFGSQLHASDYVPVGIPSIMPVNIGDNRLVRDGIACIRPSDAERLARHIVRKGDIIYSRRGDVERRALVREAEDGWFCGTGCLKLRLGEGVIEPEFASYYLGHPEVRAWIVRHAVGATMPNLNTSIMESIPFLLPPPDDQRAIAAVLGSLDDKIEVNRRTARVLEGLARTIFRSWFVDFDPVRRAAAGEPTGLPDDLAALFPTRLVDSPLGDIPDGWEVGTLGDTANINANTLGKSDPLDIIDYIEISEVMRGEVKHITRYERGSEPSRARRRLTSGDTVLSTVRPDRGAYFLCLNPSPSLVASTGFAVLTPKIDDWAFVYIASTRAEVSRTLGQLADGGAYPAVRPEVVAQLPLMIPDEAARRAFQRTAEPIMLRAFAARQQSATLASLRDSLLPKLISGDLPVPAAEAVVAEVG